ncbi:MAG: Sec-independent protein translocase protein TatB [Gammaproteobacteria bacterium]
MFDIGFWELIIISIVALIIVGPERLPSFARKAGKWLGKLRGFVNATRHKFEQELQLEEANDLARKITDLDELLKDVPDKDPDFVLKNHKKLNPDDPGKDLPK